MAKKCTYCKKPITPSQKTGVTKTGKKTKVTIHAACVARKKAAMNRIRWSLR